MSGICKLLLILTVSMTGLCLGCDTTDNSNSADKAPARNENAAKANTNENRPASNANANNSNGISRTDVERDAEKYRKQAKDAGRKVGESASDLWLWVKTRTALAAADDLRDSTINVDVDDSVVTLSGSVANASQKSRAEQLAKEVEGVKSVKNTLRIAASGTPNATSDKTPPPKK